MRIRLPKPQEMFPDPRDRPTLADLQALQDNPMFLLLLARLQQAEYKARSKQASDDEEIEMNALAIIERAVREVSTRKEEE